MREYWLHVNTPLNNVCFWENWLKKEPDRLEYAWPKHGKSKLVGMVCLAQDGRERYD